MNQIREIEKINQQELERGIAGTSASWHSQFANSAWVYVGNLDHQLTEGDVICVMSQYGEIEDIHLVREEDTGKSRGFGFLKYEDARSCVLAVDNLCGVMILGRSLRVDHVENYRLPKKLQEHEQRLKEAGENPTSGGGAGHAYEGVELENKYSVHQGMDLFAPPSQSPNNDASKIGEDEKLEKLKRKEERQRKREEKEERRRQREEKREKYEERKRRKRSRKHRDDRDGSDRSYSEEETKDRRRSRDEKYSDASVDGNSDKERRDRKRHRSNRSHKHEKKKKKHRSD